MKKVWTSGVVAVFVLLSGMASAQQAKPAVDEEEQIDSAMRKFGYVSGQAFQCHTKEQQVKLERTALDVGTNVLRLFGSDRAFFFAAAFGAGAAEQMDTKKCPRAIKQADEMIGKLKVLSSR
jgi:hypothetical protein